MYIVEFDAECENDNYCPAPNFHLAIRPLEDSIGEEKQLETCKLEPNVRKGDPGAGNSGLRCAGCREIAAVHHRRAFNRLLEGPAVILAGLCLGSLYKLCTIMSILSLD